MAQGNSGMDWSLVQAFLAVADGGSLSAAARALRTSQPTVGRKVKALEEQLGAELFQRHDRGLALTELGRELLEPARSMRDAVARMELSAVGGASSSEGTVRITASAILSSHHLPAIIAKLRLAEPRISIELHPSDESSNLHFREADIAVRMYRPTQLDLVTRHLGDISIAAFASRSYVERRGVPQSPQDLPEHDIIGFDRSDLIVEGFSRAGFQVDREWFKVRCDDQCVYWQLVRAGVGIGFGQRPIGLRDPDLVEVPFPLGIPAIGVWLTAHEAIRGTPRVTRVWELLVEELQKTCDA